MIGPTRALGAGDVVMGVDGYLCTLTTSPFSLRWEDLGSRTVCWQAQATLYGVVSPNPEVTLSWILPEGGDPMALPCVGDPRDKG